MPPKTRRRYLSNRQDTARFERVNAVNPANNGVGWVTSRLGGEQMTVSEGHDWPASADSGDDVGGDFYTVKRTFNDNRGGEGNTSPLATVRSRLSPATQGERVYHGPVFPVQITPANWPSYYPVVTDFATSKDNLLEMGTTAISIVKPTNSAAELSTLLGEVLREGLPKAPGVQSWKNRTDNVVANASGEYLNFQFGIAPIISEIDDLKKAVTRSDRIIAQYERDAGRNVRRQFHFPLEESTDVISTQVGRDPFPLGSGPSGNSVFGFSGNNPIQNAFIATAFDTDTLGNGTLTRVDYTRRKTWFSGAFTYHLPSDSTAWGKMRRASVELEKVYGIGIDPSTLYNLSPWSWALDWFSSTGAVVDNLSDYLVHGLVMRYGYIMQTAERTSTYTLTGHRLRGFSSPISCSFTTTVKQRYRATPFGFGLSWDGFTPFQASIVAALGISRFGR